MRIASYQAPLLPNGSALALELLRRQVERCETEGIAVLCCPEAILGGLADYADDPGGFALDAEAGQLAEVLAPLASPSVTTIVGFTEVTRSGWLYNSAAVFHQGAVLGWYRKRHPAIRRSVYHAGSDGPTFTIPGLSFGILICNDSNDPALAGSLASRGAAVVFVPSNNALPSRKADIVPEARRVDCAAAAHNRIWIVRSDVAGSCGRLLSYGSAAIVNPRGEIVASAQPFAEDLLVADVHRASAGIPRATRRWT